MLRPVSEGGAIDLLLDCVCQSVQSALSLYISCLTSLQRRELREEAGRVSDKLFLVKLNRISFGLCLVFVSDNGTML